LLAGNALSVIERKFLDEIRHSLHRTPAQQKWLDRLIARAVRGDNPTKHRRHGRGIADGLDDEIVW
jgi:hypothetical protein